jgi:hypothetical protein
MESGPWLAIQFNWLKKPNNPARSVMNPVAVKTAPLFQLIIES